ncbi:DUF1257 domain-containing protein [bacterium]|nr:DUF1257 domain-containing protein [candidate division CSSED10-310 bacterium]
MSCVFIVTPFVVGNWAVLTSLVGGAAAHLGYRMARSAAENYRASEAEQMQSVELELENSEVIADQLRRGDVMVLTREAVTITISLDGLGRMKAAVSGPESMLKDELEQLGQEFLNQVIQQYAYQKIIAELKIKGFSLIDEQVESDGRIRLKVRKYE